MTEHETQTAGKPKSDDILDHLKHKKDKGKIVDVEEERVLIVIFQLSGSLFGIYGGDAKEVLEVKKITAVPGSPDFIVGIVNVRGDVESVIDLNRFLQLPPERESAQIMVIIAQYGEMRSGIRVTAIEDVVEIPKSSVKPAITTLGENIRHYAIGEMPHNGKNVTLLDVGRIFEKIAAE